MKIAIIGTRGIPARYGGFETCAERIAEYLAGNGHRILVTCRKYLYPDKPVLCDNIETCYPFCIRGKNTETLSHSFFSIIKVLMWNPDIVLIFNAANSPAAIIAKIFGKKIVINVDGLEWKRKKWGFAGKTYFRFASFLSTIVSDCVVADSLKIAEYYQSRFHVKPVYIPYGADIINSEKAENISKFGLESKRYFFTGSRLEPENNQDLMIQEFNRANLDIPLVIAGDIQSKSCYVKMLKSIATGRVKFIGRVYEKQTYTELQAHSLAYIHGNEVGGTNPALLSAMGSGAVILALDVPFNREVLGSCGLYFTREKGSLSDLMKQVVENPEKFLVLGNMARERAEKLYRWEEIGGKYENLFFRLKNEK